MTVGIKPQQVHTIIRHYMRNDYKIYEPKRTTGGRTFPLEPWQVEHILKKDTVRLWTSLTLNQRAQQCMDLW